MRIVVLHGFNSSSVMNPENINDAARYAFLGGNAVRGEIEDADIIIGVWPPDPEAIVVKAPDGATVETVTFPHMQKPQLKGSITAEEFTAAVQARASER